MAQVTLALAIHLTLHHRKETMEAMVTKQEVLPGVVVVAQAVQGKLLLQTPTAMVALVWRRPLQALPSLEQLEAEALITTSVPQSMER
jgi:hypothetical protein